MQGREDGRPTMAQIGEVLWRLEYAMSIPEAMTAIPVLERYMTSEEVDQEIERLDVLIQQHKLDRDTWLEGEIWKKYYGKAVSDWEQEKLMAKINRKKDSV